MSDGFAWRLRRARMGVVTVDGENRILALCPTAAALLGVEPERLIGRAIPQIHPDGGGRALSLLEAARQGGATVDASMAAALPHRLTVLKAAALSDGAVALALFDLADDAAPANDRLLALPVDTADGVRLLPLDQITHIDADGRYAQAHSPEGPRFCSLSLQEIERRVPPDALIRAHRSHLINPAAVTGWERRGDAGVLLLRGGATVPVGRSRWDGLRRRFSPSG